MRMACLFFFLPFVCFGGETREMAVKFHYSHVETRDEILRRASAPALSLEEAEKAFCERPYDAVCGSGGGRGERVEQQLELDRFKRRIQEEVASSLKKKLKLSKENEEDLYETGPKPKGHGMEGNFAKYVTLLYDRFNELARIPDYFYSEAREALLSAVQRFNKIARADKMQSRVQNTLWIYSRDTLKKAVDKYGTDVLDVVSSFCGRLGLVDNAVFNAYYNIFIICPGALAASVKDKGKRDTEKQYDSNFIRGNLYNLVTHEQGHAIHPGGCNEDEEVEGEVSFQHSYERLIECLYRNFGHPTKEVEAEMTYDAFKSYACEDVPDMWSGYSAPELLRSEKDPKRRFLLLREMLMPYCFQPGNEAHPSGRYRIEVFFAANPEIRAVMGCSPVLACTPYGEFKPIKSPG